MTTLRRDRQLARSAQRERESREDREVGVKPDALQSPDAQRRESVVVLQAAELALNGRAAAVEVAEPLTVARDAREQTPSEREWDKLVCLRAAERDDRLAV